MNEVHLDRKQFVEALKVIAPKRLTKQSRQLPIDLSAKGPDFFITRPGVQTSLPILSGEWSGYTTVDLGTILSFRTLNLQGPAVRIVHRDGRIYIDAFSVPAPWVNAADWISSMSTDVRVYSDPDELGVVIRNCPNGANCTEIWDNLPAAKDPSIRFCEDCSNPVKLCTTPYKIRVALLDNLVIAIRAGG